MVYRVVVVASLPEIEDFETSKREDRLSMLLELHQRVGRKAAVNWQTRFEVVTRDFSWRSEK